MGVSSGIAIGGIARGRASSGCSGARSPTSMARSFAPIHRLLLNKYYVDEIYDATIVQPLQAVSREGLWRGVDVGRHRRRRQRRRRRIVDAGAGRAAPAADRVGAHLRRLALPRRRADPRLLPVEIRQHVPLLTLSWTLPLAGALLLLLVGNADGRRDGLIRWLALGISLVAFAVTLAHLGARSTPASAEFQFVERVPWIPAFGIDYYVGIDGISLLLVVLTGFLTPDRAAVVVGGRGEEGQGVLDLHPRARGGDDRRLRLARPVPVLRVLGRDAHPDVLPDRDLGLRPAHLRRGQVHALHDGGQRPDARRHPRPGLPAQRGDRQLQLRPAEAVRAARSPRRRSAGSSWRSRWRSPSRCRSSRSTPGCPTRTCRRRPPARSSWPACC